MAGWSTIAGALCLAVVLSRPGARLAAGCGPFPIRRAAFGPGAGFVVAWSYWISMWVGQRERWPSRWSQPVDRLAGLAGSLGRAGASRSA